MQDGRSLQRDRDHSEEKVGEGGQPTNTDSPMLDEMQRTLKITNNSKRIRLLRELENPVVAASAFESIFHRFYVCKVKMFIL
jgi:hypothetical protein